MCSSKADTHEIASYLVHLLSALLTTEQQQQLWRRDAATRAG
jgi:hypothetical protein